MFHATHLLLAWSSLFFVFVNYADWTSLKASFFGYLITLLAQKMKHKESALLQWGENACIKHVYLTNISTSRDIRDKHQSEFYPKYPKKERKKLGRSPLLGQRRFL